MSVPRELLDQLLSGYLDDALSPDERARVEQLLQSDDEIVKELDQLRELQSSLKAISAADSAIKLDEGFADRVLGAAVARAHAEGLSDDHPLVRLAEQPSTSRTGLNRSGKAKGHYSSSSLRVASLMVGLAASIVIAVIAFRPDSGTTAQNRPELNSLAGQENTPLADPIASPVETPFEDPIVDPAPEMIVSNPAENGLQPESADPVTPDPVVATDPRMESLEPAAPVESIAEAPKSLGSPVESKVDIAELGIGPILIIDVRLTEAGRNSDPIGDALAYAKIEPASEKKITDEIAGFAQSTSAESVEDASILYLQVPGKKADLFYLRLMADQVGVASVGLRFAMDAPITKMVNAIKPDPTMVRHDDAALQLFTDGGVVDEFTSHLSGLDFRLQDRTKPVDEMPKVSTGPDISAQILVLVR